MSEFSQPQNLQPIIDRIPSQNELNAHYSEQIDNQVDVAAVPSEMNNGSYAVRRSNGELEAGWSLSVSYSQADVDGTRVVTGYELTKPAVDAQGNAVIGPDGKQQEYAKNVSAFDFISAQREMAEQTEQRQNAEHEKAARASAAHLLGRTANHLLRP